MNNNLNKNTNTPQNINILHLAFCLFSLIFLMTYKFVDFTVYGTIDINIFDFLTIIISTLGSILSITYLKFKSGLIEEAITATLCTLSLFFSGIALFVYNNPLDKHRNLFLGASIITYLVIFIFVLITKIGVETNSKDIVEKTPDIKWLIVPALLSGFFITAATSYIRYISRVYYNGSLIMRLGLIFIYLGALYTIIVAIYIKKIRLNYKS